MNPLAVLLYHTISDDPPSWVAPFAVGTRTFLGQLDAVVDSGRPIVTASQVVASRRGGPALPPDAVALTFDDGFRDFAETAAPALAARSLPAALFVTTGALHPHHRSVLGDAPMLSMDEVVALDRAGVEICSHAHMHEQLDTLPPQRITQELLIPKWILEEALGHVVPLYAYPYGYSSLEVRNRTRHAGYLGSFAVRNAFSPDDDDPYRIARLMVCQETSPETFASWLRGAGAPTASAHEQPQTMLWRQYRRSRARLHAVRR
ncbi:peptidoglycan/xylan/chitin deacetylase (PgdA/CDA1 family) [Catenulispora sp. GP43]|uniref:polysaccharide deacetylase family protein n=1 Tax=Catenulispora sp. GP43 TaxID=3156263 RepID=UPI00351398A3